MSLLLFVLPATVGVLWLGVTLRDRRLGAANLIALTAFCLVLILAYGWFWLAIQPPPGVDD